MKPVRFTIAVLSTLALAAAADSAFAQQAKPRTVVTADDFTAQSNLGSLAPRRTLQWDARKGRWGLKVDVDQPTDRDVQAKDVAVGFTYRVTPRVRVGPSVTFQSDAPSSLRRIEPQQPAPRVRLETTFKF